jgi:hypothetical protein
MDPQYLLYVDILGFSSLTENEPERVDALMRAIDHSPAHTHGAFKSIVFSDTILVSTVDPPASHHDREYVLMYLIEYAILLHRSLVGSGIKFRGLVREGEFKWTQMDHFEAFFGAALIRAYEDEKKISCTGLFVERILTPFNYAYPSMPYDDAYDFVFLAHNIDFQRHFLVNIYEDATWPIDDDLGPLMVDSGTHFGFEEDVSFLQELHEDMSSHSDARVREKLQNTWSMYARRYPELTDRLVQCNFDLSEVITNVDWNEPRLFRERELRKSGLATGL